jgi:beta-lactam-binding protein with PASTA domain
VVDRSEEDTRVVRGDPTERVVDDVPTAVTTDSWPSYGEPAGDSLVASHTRRRVGRDSHERERFDDFWPALAILLLATLLGLGAWWFFTRPEMRTVPAVRSLSLDQASSRLENEGFEADPVRLSHRTPVGNVFDQRPAAGLEGEEGSTVTVFVSKGPATVSVPNAVGLSKQAARDRLESSGLGVRVFEVVSDEPEGTVVAQSPTSGELVSKADSVRVNVSAGRP